MDTHLQIFKFVVRLHLRKCFSKVISKNANYETLGSWENKLILPMHVEQSVRQGHLIPRISLKFAGVSTLQGRRNLNEDRILLSQITKNVLMLALFDGHGSPTAAEFAQVYLERSIKYWLLKNSHDLRRVLSKSFHDCNNMMAHHLIFYSSGQNRLSGTTATVALIKNNLELVVASVGDSRALMCRSGNVVPLSIDDDPGNETEQARIENAGGMITTNSLGVPVVNGRLGMTRSLGDMELKRYGVIADPHLYDMKISHGRDAYCVIISDGISYVMSNDEIIELISVCKDPQEAARCITDLALQYGSEDNVSAIVLPFGSWGKYAMDKMKKALPVTRHRFNMSRSMFD